MLKPESYRAGGHNRRAVVLDPQGDLVEVVRDRNLLAAYAEVLNGLGLAHLIECNPRHNIDLLRLTYVLQAVFQRIPYCSVESVLNLRHLVGHVEGLLLHSRVAVSRAVRAEVSARIRTSVAA